MISSLIWYKYLKLGSSSKGALATLTWSSGLLLDERVGVSYPDGQMDSAGRIRIIYDRDRTGDREILIATFREQDLKAGELVAEDSQLRQVVSRIGG